MRFVTVLLAVGAVVASPMAAQSPRISLLPGQRVALRIPSAAFPVLWNLGAADTTMSGAFGFAVRAHMKSNYSGVMEGSQDYVTIYALADAARQFAAGAIAGRELMARSIAMFNGNQVKLELAKQ